jgi:branched-chain amino acid transport system ATP-binding protein
MGVIKTLSDRVYVLDGGQMLATGTFEEVVANERVREAYLG